MNRQTTGRGGGWYPPVVSSDDDHSSETLMTTAFYPIGTPGTPWGDSERDAWRQQRTRLRSYAEEVVPRIKALSDRFDVSTYGALDYNGEVYTMYAVRSRDWNPA